MLIAVAAFLNVHEAHLFKTRLEAENIGAFIQGEDFVYLLWPYATAVGGVRVCVVADEVTKTHEVIANCINGTYRRELEAEFGELDDVRCPSCGSTSIKSRSSYGDLVLLAAVFFIGSAIFPARARAHIRSSCGRKWPDD